MTVDLQETEWATNTLSGDTLASVVETIAGMEEAATTEWWPSLSYETTGLAVSSASITLKSKVTLPEWSGYDSASEAEQAE